MKEAILSPHAASLIQSMRDLGYSLETALADLVDNSITAHARNVRIYLTPSEYSLLAMAIADDGLGMTETELLNAMRPGSHNPRDSRAKDDLGRFGLGLKTASFSQARLLTVVSRKQGQTVAAQWDLDLVTERNEWVVTIPSPNEIASLPHIDKLGEQGTCVLWRKLDRFSENKNGIAKEKDIYEKLSGIEHHLALVFHRYLFGEFGRQKLSIFINGHQVSPFDPFCTSNKATQVLPEERLRIDGSEVVIQPYILPHHSKLSKPEFDFYTSYNDFVTNQGAYVYRNARLMAWGDWFNLVPRTEATKLARVKIDFSNVLDEYWTIDIKKSRARPPQAVREKLQQIISRITERSRLVHLGRGNRLFDPNVQPLWIRYGARPGTLYGVNRDHPLIESFREALAEDSRVLFEDILTVIERAVPIEAIYADYAAAPKSFEEESDIPYEDLKTLIRNLYGLMCSAGSMDKAQFARMIMTLKPFSEHVGVVEGILKELL